MGTDGGMEAVRREIASEDFRRVEMIYAQKLPNVVARLREECDLEAVRAAVATWSLKEVIGSLARLLSNLEGYFRRSLKLRKKLGRPERSVTLDPFLFAADWWFWRELVASGRIETPNWKAMVKDQHGHALRVALRLDILLARFGDCVEGIKHGKRAVRALELNDEEALQKIVQGVAWTLRNKNKKPARLWHPDDHLRAGGALTETAATVGRALVELANKRETMEPLTDGSLRALGLQPESLAVLEAGARLANGPTARSFADEYARTFARLSSVKETAAYLTTRSHARVVDEIRKAEVEERRHQRRLESIEELVAGGADGEGLSRMPDELVDIRCIEKVEERMWETAMLEHLKVVQPRLHAAFEEVRRCKQEITVENLARHAGVSRPTIYQWCAATSRALGDDT